MSPPRDPEQTRQHILEVTAEEMRQRGFKAASLSEILDKAQVSKGALYHHFANKQELGYAVFDEIFVREFLADWNVPLSAEAPIEALCDWVKAFSEQITEEELQVGCPIYNISTEMAAADEGFREKTIAMFEALQERFVQAIRDAQSRAQVKEHVDADAVAAFIVAVIQGAMMQGKYGRNVQTFKSSITCMADYLASLKR